MKRQSVVPRSVTRLGCARPALVALALAAVCLGFGTAAKAGCPIDFENLAAGTAVTTQYRGVTFSVIADTCAQPLSMRIASPEFGPTASGLHCLKIDRSCYDFSPEGLRMVFDSPQNQVSFMLGDINVHYTIRAYTTTSDTDGLVDTQIVVPSLGVRTLVRVISANIRRIEVQAEFQNFEAVDDLTFDSDLTPPLAEITSPGFGECVCANEVVVRGRACEDSAFYGRDVLEYKPVTGGDWTLIGSYTSPACDPNSWLYTWPTTAVADGTYYLRLTVTNKCGLRSEAITVVHVNHTVPPAVIRQPVTETPTPMIVGGQICIDGSAGNYGCFDHYTVGRRPDAGGDFVPVDQPQYATAVNNDPLATWNTANNATPDGDYVIRATVFDRCGHPSAPQDVTVRVDNTSPIGFIAAPMQCSKRSGIIPVYGTAYDANLSSWVLQYSDLSTHGWTDIASGSSVVISGLLANWDTTGLPTCAYALRLVVTDKSRVNLDCSGNSGANQTNYIVTLDVVSDPLAQDTDADGLPDAWETTHGLNPNDPSDAAKDVDNDGATNLDEFLAGTDPSNAASALRITAISRDGSDTSLTWNTVESHNYVVEQKTSLDSGSFSAVSSVISIPPNESGTTTFVHRGATEPTGFYRVHLLR